MAACRRRRPDVTWNCPSWASIKGNAPSRIYHLPGQRYYSRTTPEICFATEAAAQRGRASGGLPGRSGMLADRGEAAVECLMYGRGAPCLEIES
ncbi:sunset domain-containing protein [Arthrobacter horti]|uniref:sunset domain-containing protein n=1 Tax=Arthrobacter horti TaxID=3068273 RepID=UPI003F5805AE